MVMLMEPLGMTRVSGSSVVGIDTDEEKRITFIGSQALGDLVMERAHVEYLSTHFPDRQIYVAVDGFKRALFDNLGIPNLEFISTEEALKDPRALNVANFLEAIPHLQKTTYGGYLHLVDWIGYSLSSEIGEKMDGGRGFLEGKVDPRKVITTPDGPVTAFLKGIGPEHTSEFHPSVNLTKDEYEFGDLEVSNFRKRANGKPIILIYALASCGNKNWDDKEKLEQGAYGKWQDLVDKLGDDYYFVQLQAPEDPAIARVEKGRFETATYKDLREGAGVTAAVDGVISVDTYGLHAAVEVRTEIQRDNLGIVAILPSSNRDTVSYDGVINVEPSSDVCIFHQLARGCGNHDYVADDVYSKKASRIIGTQIKFYDNHCVYKPEQTEKTGYPCVEAITTKMVGDALREAVPLRGLK